MLTGAQSTGPSGLKAGQTSKVITLSVIMVAVFGLFLVTTRPANEMRRADLCITNLNNLHGEFRPDLLTDELYPSGMLNSLPKTLNPSLFVCPNSGHGCGSMTNLNEWTDYIYLSGERLDEGYIAKTAIIICPPENHGGKFGHVTWGGGGTDRLLADKVQALIKDPTCMQGESPAFRDDIRGRTTLHVPPRFRSIYASWHNQPTNNVPR